MDSAAIKTEIINQVRAQYAIDNVKQLIDKVNEHCFLRCVPKPGSSLSSSEQTCFTQCMEKYMNGWNQISAACISQLQQERGSNNSL